MDKIVDESPNRLWTAAETAQLLGDGTTWIAPGPLVTIDNQPSYWRVQATCTSGDRAGSSATYPAQVSLAAARAHMDQLRADPAEANRYDTWEIVRSDALIRHTLIPAYGPDPDCPACDGTGSVAGDVCDCVAYDHTGAEVGEAPF